MKLSQFENNDSRLLKVVLYPIFNGYIYFDSYRNIGTEVHLKRGVTKVSTLQMKSEKSLASFKKELSK
jgi:type IV secretory pathway VirB6-like protein